MQNWWLKQIVLLHKRSILNPILMILWISTEDGKSEQIPVDPQVHLFLSTLLVSSNVYCVSVLIGTLTFH